MNFLKRCLLTALVPTLCVDLAIAAPTAQEAAELGKSLTPLGAIKAGNAAGTIPAWDGGLCKPVAGYKPKDPSGGWPYIDPYASDKPRLVINAANMAQYADQLTEGTKVMLQRYPDTYRLDVYPTHRSACFPDFVYKNTIDRVMSPKLSGTAPGVVGAHSQIPFPVPHDGNEAMWNSLLRYVPPYETFDFTQFVVDSAGNRTVSNGSTTQEERQYWDNNLPESTDTTYWKTIATQTDPPSQAGTKNMRWQFVRMDLQDPQNWSYVPGQRRVRLAPEFTYDTVSTTSGVLFFDEINGFDGKMDKYDFKLLGRKEVFVPYNSYRRFLTPQDKAHGVHHVMPEAQRWELHRVWVVEGTLKPGERHAQLKKKFYLDEDSWAILAYVGFDHQDKPNRYYEGPTFPEYDKSSLRTNGIYDLYDLSTSKFTTQVVPGGRGMGHITHTPWPVNTYSPTGLAGRGVR